MLRRFGRRAALQLWGERGDGGGEGQDKTPMHKLCSFFFFINAVRFPGIVVSISSQAKLIWCLVFFFNSLPVWSSQHIRWQMNLVSYRKRVGVFLESKAFLCCLDQGGHGGVRGCECVWCCHDGRTISSKTSGDVQQWQGTVLKSSN